MSKGTVSIFVVLTCCVFVALAERGVKALEKGPQSPCPYPEIGQCSDSRALWRITYALESTAQAEWRQAYWLEQLATQKAQCE